MGRRRLPRREGSSPLARGTLDCAFGVEGFPGLIPARAGNTRRMRRICGCRRAHPRSRGEHVFLTDLLVPPLGSSPLARGTQPRTRLWCGAWGLIPARAGNTSAPIRTLRCARAHPRSRGEHSARWATSTSRRGSSPLARGTPSRSHPHFAQLGLIPARAGNTVMRRAA